MERGTAMIFVLLLAAMLIGAGQPLQAAINAQLRARLGDPAWGLIGLPVHHISPLRILGVGLLVGGVVLVRAF
jgi:uncharacterized membrane protein YdcZ (DUF606 family)